MSYVIIAELTPQNNNIHYHCKVVTNLEHEEFVTTYKILSKELGFSDVKQLKTPADILRWETYINKDIEKTKKYLNTIYEFEKHNSKMKKDLNTKFIFTNTEKHSNFFNLLSNPKQGCITEAEHIRIQWRLEGVIANIKEIESVLNSNNNNN